MGNARQALMEVAQRFPGEDIGLSVVTIIELMHGAARAKSPEER
jgi:predicted nucleic acid-binding protein